MAHRDGIYQRGSAWWLSFMHHGKRYQMSLGRGISRKVAQELAQVKRAAILKGEAGIGKKKKDILFSVAAESFLEYVEANNRVKTVIAYKGSIDRLNEFFGDKQLGEISAFLIEKYKLSRLENGARRFHRSKGARVAINRELACLSAIFNRIAAWKKYEGPNPVRGVKRFEESKGRVRFLEEKEEHDLLAAATEPLRTIILVGIHAGLRVFSEALTLTWTNVDLRLKTLTVEAAYAKGKETRTVPLNSVLVEALRRLHATRRTEFVFTKQDGQPLRSIKTAFTTACRRANLLDVTPHVLRHTFGSNLAMAGVDPRTIQELGGWKDLKMVMRYTHLSQLHKQEAVEKIVRNITTIFTTVTPAADTPSADNLRIINRMPA
jgi:integrase